MATSRRNSVSRTAASIGADANTVLSPRLRWIVFAVLAAFAAILLLPYFHGHWRLADDAYEFTLPNWRFQERVLQLGQWPHWNLNEGFGKPTAVNGNAIFFYPFAPIWGLLVGWTEASQLVFIYLHLLLGSWLAFRFSRRLGHTLETALFFAITYIGNGYVLGFFACMPLLIPFLIWPLLGEGLWDLYAGQKRGGHAVTKIALALILIESGGYPLVKLLIYVSTGIAALPLVKKNLRPLVAAGVIAILCTAPEWASAFRALPLSERMGADIYGDISYGSPTNFMALGTLLVPTAFFKRDGFQLGMVWLERSWWVGALTLAMLLTALRDGTFDLGRYRRLALISLGGLLFAFGGHSFFRELSSIAIPLLEHLRFANMGRMLPMAFLVFMGAAGFNALQASASPQADPRARKHLGSLWVIFLVACTLAALSQLESSELSYKLYLDPATQWVMGALHTAFYLLLAYTVYTLRNRLRPGLGWAAMIVGVQFLSLADVGYAFRHLIAKEVTPTASTAENFRPASPQPNERSVRQWLDGNDWIQWDGNRKVFYPYTVPFHRLMRTVAQDPRTAQFTSSLASCQDDAAKIGLRPSISGSHSCAGTQFVIDRHYGNTIEVSGQSPQPAWIMIHDFADPDWHAELNGDPVSIQPAFGVFKAVEVPGGQAWRLHFEYRHPWFPALWLISALGFVLLGATTFSLALRERLR
jgi:hypothetical protein